MPEYVEKSRGPLETATLVATVLLAAVVVLTRIRVSTGGGDDAVTNLSETDVQFSGVPVLGSVTAPVVVQEFADFQCPFCARFARDTLPLLIHQYVDTDAVAIAFREYPLAIHKAARAAAVAAECAGRDDFHACSCPGDICDIPDAFFCRPGGE